MEEYLTIKEVAELWQVSVRRVQRMCEDERIPGVKKFGRDWAIPKGTPKPMDGRIKSGKYRGWRKSK